MPAWNAIDWTGKIVNRLTVFRRDKNRPGYWICRCSCSNKCSVSSMSLKAGQKSCGCIRREKPHNWKDLTGKRHRKLVFLQHLGGSRWLCRCDCGNETEVLVTNLSKTDGCRHCARRQDITGEKVGLLTAVGVEPGTVKGRPPLWMFRCNCGNTIQGTVREFHAQWLRSCGCHDNAFTSWSCMMGRCYDPKDPRYNNYGARGIRVCQRWQNFQNFILDMGERPKRYNLGRKHAEKSYSPKNCFWEHVSRNCRDTKNDGQPTKPGLKKGARPR